MQSRERLLSCSKGRVADEMSLCAVSSQSVIKTVSPAHISLAASETIGKNSLLLKRAKSCSKLQTPTEMSGRENFNSSRSKVL
jgi:hypothetical protein